MDPDTPPSRPPPPPPPLTKKQQRPKITLQIPDANTPTLIKPPTSPTVYWGPPKYYGKTPMTPASRISDPHSNPYFGPFAHMYQNKASDFMFKQFEGFKDFTMNTAKSGLSVGEKTAFWFYNKLKIWSKKWFTHLFLTLCLVLYSVAGGVIFMTLEGPYETKCDKEIEDVRLEISDKIEKIARNETIMKTNPKFLALIQDYLIEYENSYSEYLKHVNNNNAEQKTWTFWNSMFFAGTIYTTIAVTVVSEKIFKFLLRTYRTLFLRKTKSCCNLGMSEDESETDKPNIISIPIPKIEPDSSGTSRVNEIQSPTVEMSAEMDETMQKQSLRKRRNLSKNRTQATRQREKTPEPSRTLIPHEDTTSDDEELKPLRTSREIEADDTYEEMKRLVQEQARSPDPVYDLDTDEILEARAMAATERRRRSISPFAIPEKDKEEGTTLERKGSFIDPTNKLLSTHYVLSPKDEDKNRRGSLTGESLPTESKKSKPSLSPPITNPNSPVDKEPPISLTSAPKQLEEIIYPDEIKTTEKPKKPKTPVKHDEFSFEDKDLKQSIQTSAKESAPSTGELVTKVIQLERTPSKKVLPEQKPKVEIRERIVRTPSRKLSTDAKSNVVKQISNKPSRDDVQSKVPPVKPARSKSATRFGGKTSESEMSEDQIYQQNNSVSGPKRKVVPTPRRFIKNKSPRANRSQSMNRFDTPAIIDKTGTGMSQTSREIIEMMQKARARSLSIPKDDPRLPTEYKNYSKVLQTPNKTPTTLRGTRGISCPKTIHIISEREILAGLTAKQNVEPKYDKHSKHSRQSSGYIDASQSEYTSSCYSTSPSENEYEFDLSVKTAELTHKLNLLSDEVDKRESLNNIILVSDEPRDPRDEDIEQKSILRKRSLAEPKVVKRRSIENIDEKKIEAKLQKSLKENEKKDRKSRWKFLANWQQFKEEHRVNCNKIRLLRNKCICDTLLLIIFCGLGGMLFKTLEGSFENAYKCGSRGVKRDFIESLWRGSHYLREEDWKSMARKKLFEFENQLHSAHEAGVTSYSGQRSWNFMNSFVYCLTLITTIGYGHISPKTTSGRVATIVYAIIGIPLFLLVLTDFGKLLTRIIKFFWAYIRRFYYTRSCRKVRRTAPVQEVMKGLNIVVDVVRRPSQIFGDDDIIEDKFEEKIPPPIERKSSDVPPPLPPKPGSLRDMELETEPGTPAPSVFEVDDEFNLPISLAILILILYIIFGAVIINIWEAWDFFESFYFVFISMSTIGLGDLVPNHPMYMMSSILYLVFGLALTSMCINVVQLKLSDTFRQASVKLGATIGLTVAEEDGSLIPIAPPPVEIVPVHKPKSEIIENIDKENKDDDANNR